MEQVLIVATVLVAVVSGLTQMVKNMEVVSTRFLPFVSLFLGVLTGCAASPVMGESIVVMMWAGGIAGLASCGLYDGLKNNIGGNENG